MSGSGSEMGKNDRDKEMQSSLTNKTTDEGFWREVWRQIRLAWHLIRSPEVPLYLKVLPVLAVVYVLLPTDFIPDVFPVIGQLDDITALLVGAKVFIELAPQDVVARYVRSVREAESAAAKEAPDSGQDNSNDTLIIEGDFDVLDD